MRPRDPCILPGLVLVVLLVGATGLLFISGCSQFRRKPEFNRPPAAASTKKPTVRNRSAHLVVIGHFRTPKHPLQWGAVGPGMAEAVARTLINHGNFDVWMNPVLARRVEALTGMEPDKRAKELASIQKDFPDVRYVVNGKVTDFHHTTDVTLGTSRKRKGAQAVVAIRIDVVDLKLGRLAASDHVIGTAPSPNIPSNELYAGVSFDAYLFWSTPLGEASSEAVGETVAVLSRVAEAGNRKILITDRVGVRRVRIVGGLPRQLKSDQPYYIYRAAAGSEDLEPIRDRDTRLPLQARIEASGDEGWTAWLLGETSPETDLRGALLRRESPAELAGKEPPPPAVSAAEQ